MTDETAARPDWQTPSLEPLTDPAATADRTGGMRNALSSMIP